MSVAGIDQKLKHQRRAAAIAGIQRDHGREIAAGAVAADRQAAGIDAEAGRVGCDPARGRDGVVDGGRELVLGRQPVIDRNDDAARGVGERAADLVVALQVADHPAAAVEEDQGRLRLILAGALAAIQPQRDRPGRARSPRARRPRRRPRGRAAGRGGPRGRPRAPPAASRSPAAAGWRRRSSRTRAAASGCSFSVVMLAGFLARLPSGRHMPE